MSDAYAVNLDNDLVGVVARTEAGYRFYAGGAPLLALEGRIFESVEAALGAARELSGRTTRSSTQETRHATDFLGYVSCPPMRRLVEEGQRVEFAASPTQ
jgi:hypothetical protein